MMKQMRKANRVVIGGAMAMNTMQLMKPGANYAGIAEGSIGIGVTGLISDKIMSMGEKNRFKKRKGVV
jgi:hypothetical protein